MQDVSIPGAPPARAIRRDLLTWYDLHRRDLPWRARPGERADPYRVWLSEIMLQQTTVPHATPYFLEFTRRWPTVTALASAPNEIVMAAWAGLGYYARARNLLACARAVRDRYDGRFPGTEIELRKLPGVGDYTAAAIAAIAFGQPANVVDGNVERVTARLFAFDGVLPADKPSLKRLAADMADAARPGDWAQALMDLGSGVCRPKQPLCLTCPLRAHCLAAATGSPESYPRKAAKAPRPVRYGAAYILRHKGCVALVERPPSGLLGGTRTLPTSSWLENDPGDLEILRQAPAEGDWKPAGEVEHVFTHFSLRLRVFELEAAAATPGFHWTAETVAREQMPTVFRKALLVQGSPKSARIFARRASIGARPASVLKCQ